MTRARLKTLEENLRTVIRGKEGPIRLLLTGLLARGHVLIEDLPGMGKTTLAKALALSIDCAFRRIQFTPDLLPGDVLGVSIFHPERHAFEFRPGPVFTNVLLADEINRTNPRTQSCLLEAMNESQATVDGTTRPLPAPFFVIATQNPVEQAGTYPLPDSQLDRFLLSFEMGYPDREMTKALLKDQAHGHPIDHVRPALTGPELLALQGEARAVALGDAVVEYAIRLAEASRKHPAVAIGASPRGALHLTRAAQAHAYLLGRAHTIPDDVKAVAPAVLAHRMILRDRGTTGGAREAVGDLLRETEVPV